MSILKYTNNYRRNLELYWRQFYPNWTIPKGYHVHHIKPKGEFKDKNDPRIHHPRNLIALHPDDHITIHECRGDNFLGKLGLLALKNYSHSDITTNKISKSLTEYYSNPSNLQKLQETRANQVVSDKTRRLVGDASKRYWNNLSDEEYANVCLSRSGANNPNYNNKMSPESKQLIANANKGNSHNLGIKRPITTCPHCDKSGGEGNMKRYHFDNCKLKLT